MNIFKKSLGVVAVFLGLVGVSFSAQAFQAHAHLGHVVKGFGNTPDNMGMLPTAEAEAKIGLDHAGFAIRDLSNLASIKMHSRHTMHALNPTHIERGPGLGYGLDQAAAGIIQHIELSANSADASDGVKRHSVHIATSARNVEKWSQEAMDLIHALLEMDDAEEAGKAATRMHELMGYIVNGYDANGDGKIGWQEGEGGLAQANQHATILSKDEGVS